MKHNAPWYRCYACGWYGRSQDRKPVENSDSKCCPKCHGVQFEIFYPQLKTVGGGR